MASMHFYVDNYDSDQTAVLILFKQTGYKGDNPCDCLFAVQHIKPLLKWVNSKSK